MTAAVSDQMNELNLQFDELYLLLSEIIQYFEY